MGNVVQVPDLHVLSYDQRERLEQISKFLTNMGEPRIAAGCFESGYSAAAHAKGVELYSVAAGFHRPFEHLVSLVSYVMNLPKDVVKERLGVIDAFENRLFRTVKSSIRAEIDDEKTRAMVEGIVFADAKQQPPDPRWCPRCRPPPNTPLMDRRLAGPVREARPDGRTTTTRRSRDVAGSASRHRGLGLGTSEVRSGDVAESHRRRRELGHETSHGRSRDVAGTVSRCLSTRG